MMGAESDGTIVAARWLGGAAGTKGDVETIVRHVRKATGRDWAAYLDTAIRAAALTQAELARRSGLAESMVSRWLRGLNQPDVPNLRRVRPVLGVPMLELLVAAGHLTQDEALLRDAPEPPEPVRVGLQTEGLTAEQVRQVEGYVAFLQAQNAKEQARARDAELLRAKHVTIQPRRVDEAFLAPLAAGQPAIQEDRLIRRQGAKSDTEAAAGADPRGKGGEPLRYAAYGGKRLSKDQQERARELAKRAKQATDRTGRRVVYLDDQEVPKVDGE